MSPELRFHSIVISLTTAIVFLVWIVLNNVITRYPFLAVVLSGLISLGIYRPLSMTLVALFRGSRVVKRFILGPQY